MEFDRKQFEPSRNLTSPMSMCVALSSKLEFFIVTYSKLLAISLSILLTILSGYTGRWLLFVADTILLDI